MNPALTTRIGVILRKHKCVCPTFPLVVVLMLFKHWIVTSKNLPKVTNQGRNPCTATLRCGPFMITCSLGPSPKARPRPWLPRKQKTHPWIPKSNEKKAEIKYSGWTKTNTHWHSIGPSPRWPQTMYCNHHGTTAEVIQPLRSVFNYERNCGRDRSSLLPLILQGDPSPGKAPAPQI